MYSNLSKIGGASLESLLSLVDFDNLMIDDSYFLKSKIKGLSLEQSCRSNNKILGIS